MPHRSHSHAVRHAPRAASYPWILAIVAVSPCLAGAAEEQMPLPTGSVFQANKLAIGIGFGAVSFDSKVKVVDKKSGGRRFLDLEGNLDLPEQDNVNVIYGAYDFNQRHSLVFSYFAINRESRLENIVANFDDIILLSATLEVEDKSRFFSLGYGYNLFRDDRSSVTLVGGLNVMDLRLETTASGQLTVDGISSRRVEVAEADVLAPLPLIGLNFSFSFTPKWGISTQLALVSGSHQETSATVWQTSINSLYRLSPRAGILLGITHFDAGVVVDKDDERTDVQYGYNGLFAGVHLAF